jgi:predicted RNase H-like HicB family nuclease
MNQKCTVIIEEDKKCWYVSEVVGIPGRNTQAKTKEQLLERTREAIQAYIEAVHPVEISEA